MKIIQVICQILRVESVQQKTASCQDVALVRIRTDDGLVLIDWDTVAIAPRERDLWMLDDGSGDRDGVELYWLCWALEDLALDANVLRGPHEDNADTRKALRAIETYLS